MPASQAANKRIICNACNNPPPDSRDARSSVRNRRQATNIHCSGRALCRPRILRTCKYHANVHPLQGVTPCGLPQAVMIHNLLVGCRNLRSSLEEAHSSVAPGKDAQRTQPGDSRKQRNSASKRLTSRMRKIITIYELYKSFIISISLVYAHQRC